MRELFRHMHISGIANIILWGRLGVRHMTTLGVSKPCCSIAYVINLSTYCEAVHVGVEACIGIVEYFSIVV